MAEYSLPVIYSLLVVLFSLAGGYFPMIGQITHTKLQYYLSASAGVMLGAAFFHIMPEAMANAKTSFGWWMSLGVVGLFCIERFIAPHSHEINGTGPHHHGEEHHHHDRPDHHSGHAHSHNHAQPATGDHGAAAPAVAGWMAVVGLTLHTFMNGVALAGAVQAQVDENTAPLTLKGFAWVAALPGIAVFLAIVLHKPMDALAISTVLSRKGVSRGLIFLVQMGFACMVPIGVIAFYATRGAIEKDLQGQLTGAALAFSAGTFLFIALSDLLPEVQFHRHDRIPLFLALLLGVAFMGGIAYLEGHDHETHSQGEHGTSVSHQDEENHHQREVITPHKK
jgi:zinc and cadmium transporter